MYTYYCADTINCTTHFKMIQIAVVWYNTMTSCRCSTSASDTPTSACL